MAEEVRMKHPIDKGMKAGSSQEFLLYFSFLVVTQERA